MLSEIPTVAVKTVVSSVDSQQQTLYQAQFTSVSVALERVLYMR